MNKDTRNSSRALLSCAHLKKSPELAGDNRLRGSIFMEVIDVSMHRPVARRHIAYGAAVQA